MLICFTPKFCLFNLKKPKLIFVILNSYAASFHSATKRKHLPAVMYYFATCIIIKQIIKQTRTWCWQFSISNNALAHVWELHTHQSPSKQRTTTNPLQSYYGIGTTPEKDNYFTIPNSALYCKTGGKSSFCDIINTVPLHDRCNHITTICMRKDDIDQLSTHFDSTQVIEEWEWLLFLILIFHFRDKVWCPLQYPTLLYPTLTIPHPIILHLNNTPPLEYPTVNNTPPLTIPQR